jgi:hypothetical protein
VAAAREHLRGLDLNRFGVDEPRTFENELDRATEGLRRVLPRDAQHWGLARKVLNIFLRDCLYTSYLCEAFQLTRIEISLNYPPGFHHGKETSAGRQWDGLKRAYRDTPTAEGISSLLR